MIGIPHITATPPGTFAGNLDWFTTKHPDWAPHVLFDPSTGETMRFQPNPNIPSKALRNLAGGVETNNRPGGVYQVEIVAAADCGDYPLEWYAALRSFLWAESLHAGVDYIFNIYTHRFSNEEWMSPDLRGWYGHNTVPENDHSCPATLRFDLLQHPLTAAEVDDMDPVTYHPGGDRTKPSATVRAEDAIGFAVDSAAQAEFYAKAVLARLSALPSLDLTTVSDALLLAEVARRFNS